SGCAFALDGRLARASSPLADAWADTSYAHGKLLLTVLGGLAEFEHELIRARSDDGRRRAKDGASAPGGHPATRGGRSAGGVSAVLRREPSPHQPAGGTQPFRGKRGRRRAVKATANSPRTSSGDHLSP